MKFLLIFLSLIEFWFLWINIKVVVSCKTRFIFLFFGGVGFIDFGHIYVMSPCRPGFNAFNFIPLQKKISLHYIRIQFPEYILIIWMPLINSLFKLFSIEANSSKIIQAFHSFCVAVISRICYFEACIF